MADQSVECVDGNNGLSSGIEDIDLLDFADMLEGDIDFLEHVFQEREGGGTRWSQNIEAAESENIKKIQEELLKDAPQFRDNPNLDVRVDVDETTADANEAGPSLVPADAVVSYNVKERLQKSVKKKMAQEGKSFDDDAQQDIPTPIATLTEEEIEKDAIRKERNRQAASRSRQKKVTEKLELEKSIASNEQQVEVLKHEVAESVRQLGKKCLDVVNICRTKNQDQGNPVFCPKTKAFLQETLHVCATNADPVSQESGDQNFDFLSSNSQTIISKDHVLPAGMDSSQLCPSSSSSAAAKISSGAGASYIDYMHSLATSVSRFLDLDTNTFEQHVNGQNSSFNRMFSSNINNDCFALKDPTGSEGLSKFGVTGNVNVQPSIVGNRFYLKSQPVSVGNGVNHNPQSFTGDRVSPNPRPPFAENSYSDIRKSFPCPPGHANVAQVVPWPAAGSRSATSTQSGPLHRPSSADMSANFARLNVGNESVNNVRPYSVAFSSTGAAATAPKYVGCKSQIPIQKNENNIAVDYSRIFRAKTSSEASSSSSSVWAVDETVDDVSKDFLLCLEPPAQKRPRLE
ncbi:hypothetical protein ElyMa_006491000 [Elysia marginata]|uniref:BZIP domain-containing protein n=1 Tax=Elysia marginata TaxID=1093978 RepID=A0AAV4I2W0_9GAST|nr:hypothetical protein ElyMa_006491000 [Elysia marginata]